MPQHLRYADSSASTHTPITLTITLLFLPSKKKKKLFSFSFFPNSNFTSTMKPENNNTTITMLAKTDSEVSSLTQSSPTRSRDGLRAVYYVQSPSRDSSNDGEKTTNSFNSSPLQSPLGSPPHSHSNSSLGPHSRESSSTRYSASRKSSQASHNNRKGNWRPWKDQFNAIEEEGLLDDDDDADRGFPRRCYFPAFVVCFFVLFTVFSLILWAASRPQKPAIFLKVFLHHF